MHNGETMLKLPPIPSALSGLLARLPQYPASAIFATALTLQVGDALGSDARPEFKGKVIRLHVTDAGVTVTLRVSARGFSPSAASTPDITLTASAADFLALASHQEDADTLFFSRRLTMEGDTELGLFVKNAIDALEFKPTLPAPRDILRMLRGYLP